jgi:hypothetical protein
LSIDRLKQFKTLCRDKSAVECLEALLLIPEVLRNKQADQQAGSEEDNNQSIPSYGL